MKSTRVRKVDMNPLLENHENISSKLVKHYAACQLDPHMIYCVVARRNLWLPLPHSPHSFSACASTPCSPSPSFDQHEANAPLPMPSISPFEVWTIRSYQRHLWLGLYSKESMTSFNWSIKMPVSSVLKAIAFRCDTWVMMSGPYYPHESSAFCRIRLWNRLETIFSQQSVPLFSLGVGNRVIAACHKAR